MKRAETRLPRTRPVKRIPPLLLCPLLFSLPVLISCEDEAPVIRSLDPAIGMLGELLSIEGERFGGERGESYVTIAGIAPTASSYVEWGDTLIRLRLPEFGDSGLVRVHTGAGRSNALLFSNRATMPAPVEGEDFGIGPRISSIEPGAAQVGSLVSIFGSGFGNSREQSGVFFAWDAESAPGTPAENRSPGFVEVVEGELGYDLWTDREIRVRVPDGAVSGNAEIRTARGVSRPVFFEVSGRPGTKTFKNRRSYTFSYSVQVQAQEAAAPNTLYLWIPRPAVSASQRNPELLSRSAESFVENYRGTSLFRLVDLEADSTVTVDQTWVVEVYAQETNLRYQQIKQDTSSPIHAAYTRAEALIPAGDGRILDLAEKICGRERNPYLKARRIYEWLVAEADIGSPESAGVLEALERGSFDSYTASLLFCSLARAAGVPAVPVSGVLVSRGETVRHCWAEFWIDGFGWTPLDIALGAASAPPGFTLREDAKSWYFGNLDNQRIAFSRGENALAQMDPRGRTVARNREYALQNLWEEAVGGLKSYSSLWGDVTITGIYAR
ncbi:MAG: IPT/TIG domain-containing protein [Treponema sp.]|nr:IPT/TIG domain-containing protein [Treponema sp.]